MNVAGRSKVRYQILQRNKSVDQFIVTSVKMKGKLDLRKILKKTK